MATIVLCSVVTNFNFKNQKKIKNPNTYIQSMLKLDNLGFGTLSGSSQLIVVESGGVECKVKMFERDGSSWFDTGITTYGFVGRGGSSFEAYEGTAKTPLGLFGVGDAYYTENKPQTGLDSFKLTENIYWINDPNSKYYNQKVDTLNDKDWVSAEHMCEAVVDYKYGFVINYNMNPIIKGNGSAIFFHISSGPTLGCVGVTEDYTLQYLAKLDKSKNPQILIVNK